jgi:hypothetical protein
VTSLKNSQLCGKNHFLASGGVKKTLKSYQIRNKKGSYQAARAFLFATKLTL